MVGSTSPELSVSYPFDSGDFEYKSNSNLSYKEQMITCHPDVKKVPRHPDD